MQKLAKAVGMPPGLITLLELEVARLQLGLAVLRHRTIDCDRGCEGDDDDEDVYFDDDNNSDENEDTDDSDSSASIFDSDNDSSILSDSLNQPSFSESDLNGSSDESLLNQDFDSLRVSPFDPSVPAKPMILSDSSTSSSDGDFQGLLEASRPFQEPSQASQDQCSRELTEGADDPWFSFSGGDAEESSTREFVSEYLSKEFHQSTDSATSSDCEVPKDAEEA